MASNRYAWMLCALGALMAAGCGSDGGVDASTGRTRFVTIGTGAITGVYYLTGGNLSKLINEKHSEYRIKATAEITNGSVFNINAILAGDMELGIVQSDRQFQAFNGLAEWEATGPNDNLRSMFSIHPEAVNLMAAVDAGIDTIHDLRGKRVNIGNPGSGQRQNSIDALENAGLQWRSDIRPEQVNAGEAPELLQDSRIDAFFYTVGHPSGAFLQATAGRRKVKFIPIENIDPLLEKYPYYSPAVIPIGLYEGAANESDVPTFGVKATVVTRAEVPDDIIYAFTREVFENLDQFRSMHEAYRDLTADSMLLALTAPIHSGAMKYFQESGMADRVPESLRMSPLRTD